MVVVGPLGLKDFGVQGLSEGLLAPAFLPVVEGAQSFGWRADDRLHCSPFFGVIGSKIYSWFNQNYLQWRLQENTNWLWVVECLAVGHLAPSDMRSTELGVGFRV